MRKAVYAASIETCETTGTIGPTNHGTRTVFALSVSWLLRSIHAEANNAIEVGIFDWDGLEIGLRLPTITSLAEKTRLVTGGEHYALLLAKDDEPMLLQL